MNTKYGVKVVSVSGSTEWVVIGSRYTFTKSKAQFILESGVKHGLFAGSTVSVEVVK